MSLPQLRIRTEYSYRVGYGPVDAVAQRLAEIGAPAAAIVDTEGTWGHVQWSKALKKVDVVPLFGAEFNLASEETTRKPIFWGIAEDLPSFYRLSSANPSNEEAFAGVTGVIRFAGSALTDPEAFDYIDINPRSRRATARSLALHKRTKRPLVVTSDNSFPGPDDRRAFLAWNDSKQATPQHILTARELRSALDYLPRATLRKAINNTVELGERLRGLSSATELREAPIISVEGSLDDLVKEGLEWRLARGHIKDWTEEYAARLERELKLIHEKNYASYFLVVADMVMWAKKRMLVGPARGSSAGSIVCYLLRITEVDPLVHGLIFERFIDVNRDDLPDIDIDFNDQRRGEVFDYLGEKYGADFVARLGSVNRLKSRSVMAHVGKKMSIPKGATSGVTNVLIEYSSGDARFGKGLSDTLENTEPGRTFMRRYPEAEIMGGLEGHASHAGQHAAGILISNEPIIEYCTVRKGIAHIDKKDAEALNLLKIDALGLRTLGVIEDAGVVTPEQLYDLPLDDQNAFDIVNDEKFSGVFQFEGASQRRVSSEIKIDKFRHLDHITALSRPGPLGGGAASNYIRRHAGEIPVEYQHESMAAYLEETLGVVLYQEQVMRIVRELGNFSWSDTSVIRKAMSGRKGQEFFTKHGEQFAKGIARLGVEEEKAYEIWNEICAFGAWGMNKSHTVSYAMISYWCAWMKHYYPLEYAAACLRSAKDDEQVVEILRELASEGVPFKPFDADLSGISWEAREGQLVGGYTTLVGVGKVKATNFVRRRDEEGGLTEKDRKTLAKLKPKHTDLHPAHTLWGDYYRDPAAHGIRGKLREFEELQDQQESAVLCRLVRLERRDEMEAVRVARRNGKPYRGPTLFLDCFVVDDSVSKPILIRFRPRYWPTIGEKLADRSTPGEDWFLVRGRWLKGFRMMMGSKIKCLTNPEMFV